MLFDTPEEIFDRFVTREKLGSRVPDELVARDGVFESLLIDGNRATTDLINASKGKFPSPYVYYVNNLDANAFVFKSSGEYFIGINLGTVFQMTDLFFRMLSHPDIFPEIGDTSLETVPPKIAGINSDAAAHINITERIRPVSKIRFQFAVGLTFYVFRFILIHEYAHIIKGHVDYLDGRDGHPFITDDEGSVTDVGSDWVRQLIELDADTCSTNIGIHIVLDTLNRLKSNGITSDDGVDSPELAILSWYFSVCAFFRLVGSKGFDPHNFYTNLYPPPSIRAYFIGFSLQLFIGRNQLDIPGDEYQKAPLKCEDAFIELSSEEVDFHHIGLPYSDEASDYIADRLEKFTEFNSLLAEFSKTTD